MKKAGEFVTAGELLGMYEMTLTSFLLPTALAVDFARFDREYRALLTDKEWKKRRAEFKQKVDEVIIRILSGNNELPPEQWLRRIPNEILVFYFDRLLCVRFALEGIAQHPETKIPVPPSWVDFWIDFLVNKASAFDQDNS